jgi:hypothetical protein
MERKPRLPREAYMEEEGCSNIFIAEYLLKYNLFFFCGTGEGIFDYDDDEESSTASEERKAIREEADPLAYKLELQRHLADLLPGDLVHEIEGLKLYCQQYLTPQIYLYW